MVNNKLTELVFWNKDWFFYEKGVDPFEFKHVLNIISFRFLFIEDVVHFSKTLNLLEAFI